MGQFAEQGSGLGTTNIGRRRFGKLIGRESIIRNHTKRLIESYLVWHLPSEFRFSPLFLRFSMDVHMQHVEKNKTDLMKNRPAQMIQNN